MRLQLFIEGFDNKAEIEELVRERFTKAAHRFEAEIMQVVVHIYDENGPTKGGLDTRCVLQAQLKGQSPLVIQSQALTVSDVIYSTAARFKQTLGRRLAKRLHFRPVLLTQH